MCRRTKTKVRGWLKAGFMERGVFRPTTQGTPQGGILSPTAAIMALDGLEQRLRARFHARYNVNLVRYPDDFIITGASSTLLADEVKPRCSSSSWSEVWSRPKQKTRIVHIDDGFDLLAFNLRKYHGELLVTPDKPSIVAVKEKIRTILETAGSLSKDVLIRRLNPVIRGWVYYYRHVVSKKVFSDIDHAIRCMTWNSAIRRHPRKGRKWLKDHYYAHKDERA